MQVLLKVIFSIIVIPNICLALVVSDPGSYARFAQQINILNDMVGNINKQLESLNRLDKSLSNINNYSGDIATQYRKHRYLLKEIRRFNFADKNIINGLDEPKKLKEFINNIYKSNPKKRDEYIKDASRAALENSEAILSDLDKNFQRIDELVDQIDSAHNIKASSDLSNRLLSELLIGQQKMISLLASFNKYKMSNAYRANKLIDISGAEEVLELGLSFNIVCSKVMSRLGYCE